MALASLKSFQARYRRRPIRSRRGRRKIEPRKYSANEINRIIHKYTIELTHQEIFFGA